MSVTSHLKDLLTKMGGTPKDGDSTSVLIDKIEDVYDDSGSGGGSSASDLPLVVTIYADDAVDGDVDNTAEVTLQLNKTFSEILRAHTDNRQITFRFETVLLRATTLPVDPMPNVTLVLHNNHSTRLEEDKALDMDSTMLILSEYVYNAYQGTSDDFASSIINPDLGKIIKANIVKMDGYYIIDFAASDGFFNIANGFECNNPDEYPSCEIDMNVLGK